MSPKTKGKKPASDAQNGTKRGRSAGKAGGSKGKVTKRAPEPPAAPTLAEAEEAAAIAQNAYNQAHPIPEPESLASRAYRAADCKEKAANLRASALDGFDKDPRIASGTPVEWVRKLADRNERDAEELDTIPGALVCGIGGEVTPADPHRNAERLFLNTLEHPTVTAAAASRVRMEQASSVCPGGTGTDSLVQALDAAETLGASNSLEKMGAHQFAAAHALAMKLMHDGAEMLRKVGNGDTKRGSTLDALALYNVEGCRLLNMATRLMTVSQGWLSTLARVRQGGRQVVTVQHVQVNDGGQAVVAGNVTPGGGGSRRGEGGEHGK